MSTCREDRFWYNPLCLLLGCPPHPRNGHLLFELTAKEEGAEFDQSTADFVSHHVFDLTPYVDTRFRVTRP
jgi:hypothetical protein